MLKLESFVLNSAILNLIVVKQLLMFSFISGLLSCSHAQDQPVGSSTYALMLNKLLSHTVAEITIKEVTDSTEALFLDAREIEEYEVSHIEGAQLVGYDNFHLDSVTDIPKNTPIIVYCAVGYRSEKVAEQLIANGYKDVKNLYGGIFEWSNQGKKLQNASGPTDSVHTFSKAWGVWLKTPNKTH